MVLFIILGFLAYREFLQVNILAYVGEQNIWKSRRFIVFLAFCALSIALLVVAAAKTRKGLPICARIEKLRHLPTRLKKMGAVALVAIPPVLFWFLPLPETIALGYWMNLFLMYCTALGAAWLTMDESANQQTELLKVSLYWMVGGCFYAAFSKLVFVTNYPFSLYWSEGNRFFDYSTLFGSSRYNLPAGGDIYAFINWGMQLPWALPFLFPGLSIGTFRLWYQLMWILPAFLLGFSAYRAFSPNKTWHGMAILFGLWAFLFLNQGPIYAPLLIAAILTMIGSRMRFVPAMLCILLASFYAHESRWTWSYAPGLWAGLSALLMIQRPSLQKGKIRTLLRPVLLGLSGLMGGRVLPAILPRIAAWVGQLTSPPAESPLQPSNAPDLSNVHINILPDITTAATRQPLLWERLFPNSTYPPGILLGLIWAMLPLILLLVFLVLKKRWPLNGLQILGALAVCAAFLGVGLTASVKIGGGSNLHNLDMFLVTLLVLAACAVTYLMQAGKRSPTPGLWVSALVSLALVSPVTYTLQSTEKPQIPESGAVQESFAVIRERLDEIGPDEEVLFIDHRQLLTFDLVPQLPLVDEYEKKKLMDEAMGGNENYFKPFYADIASHRFALIVNEPLSFVVAREDYAFSEENDAYVQWVTVPLMCTYEPIYTNRETSVELLVPRAGPPPENLPCEEFKP